MLIVCKFEEKLSVKTTEEKVEKETRSEKSFRITPKSPKTLGKKTVK